MTVELSIAQVVYVATQILAPISDSAKLDAEVLLAHILGVERVYLHTWPERKLSLLQHQQFNKLVQRRLAGEPIAYLTGYQEFWSLNLQVTPATLVPRPETELLVEYVLRLGQAEDALRIVDLGTGCGAIAIALAYERPHWQLTATDRSKAALEVAKANAQRLSLHNLIFLESDWCQQLSGQFDFIISNPPYIASDDQHLHTVGVSFEPYSALVAKGQGLADLIIIMEQARSFLKPGGHLLLEHGSEQALIVRQQLKELGYQAINTVRDLANLERMTYALYN